MEVFPSEKQIFKIYNTLIFSPQNVALNSYKLRDRLVVREKLKTWGMLSLQCNKFQGQIPKIKKIKTYSNTHFIAMLI